MPTRSSRCPSGCLPRACCRTTCISSIACRAQRISRSTTGERGTWSRRCAHGSPATWCPDWYAKWLATRPSAPCERDGCRWPSAPRWHDWPESVTTLAYARFRRQQATRHPALNKPPDVSMKKDSVIKILFVETSVEDAEQIISLLRNGGIAVRPARATSAEEIQTALDELVPDIVLYDPVPAKMSVREVSQQLEAHGRDLALVALVAQMDNQVVADLFNAGVRGIAIRSQPKQLLTVLQREHEALQTRRQVRLLEAALRESERRADALLDSSTDAIAFVHDGMHVRANKAYLDAFGYEDFDDLLCLPVLDLISSSD